MQPKLLLLYDPADENVEKSLSKHLFVAEKLKKEIFVQRESTIELPDGKASQADRDNALRTAIRDADVVVLLVTNDSLMSRYEYAMEALKEGKRLVPVLVTESQWKETDFGGLRPLPQSGRPVQRWANEDAAWTDVVTGLRQVWQTIAKAKEKVQASKAAAVRVPYVPQDPPAPGPREPAVGEKLKVLFLWANQADSSRLAISEELRQVKQRVLGATHRDRLELIAEPELRVNELAATLQRNRPQIVHFSGHGTKEGALVLANPDQLGKSQPLSTEVLTKIFQILGKDLYCVVLNSCWSLAHEEQALALADVVGCVIGLSNTVKDRAATEFSASFYEQLAFGASVRDAFDLAKLNTEALLTAEHAEPLRLYHRTTVDPKKLVLLR